MEKLNLINTNSDNIDQYGLCGYNNLKNEGYRLKIKWLKEQFKLGLRHKVLVTKDNDAIGAIEYTPGENAWRSVSAKGYLFIHCMYIMKKQYKGQGYGQKMLDACLEDAKENSFKGVAIVSRKGSWMAKKELFLKNGFEIVDQAPSDFFLLARKFKPETKNPSFLKNWNNTLETYPEGLLLVGSEQCPYVSKAFNDIREVAKNEFKIPAKIVTPKNSLEAQMIPCAFSTFAIIYNKQVIAEHPISSTRFKNIMNKIKE